MMLKNILVLSSLVCFISCSKTDMEKSVIVPSHMHEVFESNTQCSDFDFLNVKLGDQKVNYDYSGNSGNKLCFFASGNSGGANCVNCESHYANLTMPMDSYNTFFPDLPIAIGMEWESSIGKFPITEINMKGLAISLNVTDKLVDNLEIGSYKVRTSAYDKGIGMYFHWEIKHEMDGVYSEIGYTLDLVPNRPYAIIIDCIDKSSPDKIRLTGHFSGTFVGKELFSTSDEIIYTLPASGQFSYNITL